MKEKILSYLRARILPISILLSAVLLDVLTKKLVILYLKPIRSFPLIPDIFHLTYRQNTGAAWSLFSAPDERWIFMTVSSAAILLMLVYLFAFDIRTRTVALGLGAVIGGGIGNMIDRVSLGYVVDFLDACVINFPVFNVADCFITVGAVILCIGLLLEWREEDRIKAKKQKEARDAEHSDQ